MSLNDWILSLHLLSAFAVLGAMVIFSLMIVALWRTDSTRRVSSFMLVSRIGTVMVAAGTVGTFVFGVWLALSKEPYDIWDAWIVASLILWLAAGAIGGQAGSAYGKAALEAVEQSRQGVETSAELRAVYGPSRAFAMHVAGTTIILAILVLMVWKPGA